MPLPNTRVFHPDWSKHHQPTAAGQMLSECVITRPSGSGATFDEALGVTVPADAVTVYRGPCRAQRLPPALSASTSNVGEREVTVREWLVGLPADAAGIEIRPNDQVRITTNPDDPQLVGVNLRVRDPRAGTLLWQRDLTCEDIANTTR